MPRRTLPFAAVVRPVPGDLVQGLAGELQANRESGQPLITEETFPSGNIRVTVLWDAWDRLPLEDRTSVIQRAYQVAGLTGVRDKITLATGLTFPEAQAAGLLPFQILTAVRKTDSVTEEECQQAMIAEGASILLDKDNPQMRFATREEADAARMRLVARLPQSEPIWIIKREVLSNGDTGPE